MYLRLASLPVFDERGWITAPDAQGSPIGPEGEVFATVPSEAEPVTVQVEVLHDLALGFLPAPYPADRIAAPELTVSYDTATGSAITGRIPEGVSYEVAGWYVTASADRLRAIPDGPGFGEPLDGVVDANLQVPGTLPPQVEELAREWTAGADNVFDRARMIEEHLRTSFEYRDDAAFGSGPTAILEFLNEDRAGFCQQFAASMAAMLRTLDIPARVVVGFTNGVPVNGAWTVRSDRMHAWVEVLFKGVGWMPFEPTPNRTNPIGVIYDRGPLENCEGAGCPDDGVTTGVPANRRGRGQQGLIDPTPALPGRSTPREGGVPSSIGTGLSARMKLLLVAVGAGLATLVLLPLGRWFRRRTRLRRAATEPRRLILVTYEQFTERIGGVGLARAPGETLEEYRRRVLETGYLSDGHLDRLTRIATSAAYSHREPDAEDARHASDAAGTALREIRRSVGPVRWLGGLYRRA
jgi:transglutaminase-like putative cysteine protease